MKIIVYILCSVLFSVSISGGEMKQREFEFVYTTKIDGIPEHTKEVDIWIPYPQDKPYQKILDVSIKSQYPVKIYYDKKYGNSILHAKILGPKEENLSIEVRYKVLRKEKKISFDVLGNYERYLEENNLMIIDNYIKKLASDITKFKKNEFEKAKAIYDYVLINMEYDKSGVGWGRGDTKYACSVGKGNCTDFHSLFISLARAKGIPAKFVIGFLLPKDENKGEIKGYHCWAEFYIKGKGWVPVDISEAKKQKREKYFFGTCCENRVELSEGRDIILEPEQKEGELNYFIYSYCEIDGKPFENIEKKFAFKNLKGGE